MTDVSPYAHTRCFFHPVHSDPDVVPCADCLSATMGCVLELIDRIARLESISPGVPADTAMAMDDLHHAIDRALKAHSLHDALCEVRQAKYHAAMLRLHVSQKTWEAQEAREAREAWEVQEAREAQIPEKQPQTP